MKFTTKAIGIAFLGLLLSVTGQAQEIIPDAETPNKKMDSIPKGGRVKVDGVAAVIGDYVVLDSDIDKEFIQLQARGASTRDITRCQLFGKLMEDKLYAHHAIQDSIPINDLEIRSSIDQQFNAILQEFEGDVDEMLRFYGKDSETSLREEMFEINKNRKLAFEMQRKIVEEIEVTPEEVRAYFNSIPKEERPQFGTELKVSEIVVIPEISEEERQEAIDRLNEMRADVIENGASFTTKAVFYSDDTASRKDGGKYTLNRSRPMMVKEFRDVAFSLQEGEISEPFETDFGYHIVFLEKVRGQEYDVRHVLLRPKVTKDAVAAAREKITKIRERIVAGELTFADAAKEFSDEEKTRSEGGYMINPTTQDFNFELTKMDPELYGQIQDLEDGKVSLVLQDQDRLNPLKFKIIMVSDRINEHEADFAQDYLKIKNLALQDKQLRKIAEWQEEKIMDTYIKINGEYRDCEFTNNWLKIEN